MCWPIVTLYGSFYLEWTENDARRDNLRFYLLFIYLITDQSIENIDFLNYDVYTCVAHVCRSIRARETRSRCYFFDSNNP